MIKLKTATQSDIDTIVLFLKDMTNETKDVDFNKDIFTKSITKSLQENVHWLLFIDEHNKAFGTCHCQSVHNYWSTKKRFHIGGFYISPSHRKKGYFRKINQELKNWAIEHNGIQIYCHINENNTHSSESFKAVGFEKIEYDIYMNYWGD